MTLKIGDKIRGIGGDIKGCEGIIEWVFLTGRYVIRLTKLGREPWHTGSHSEWQVGELIKSYDGSARISEWKDCLELIISKKLTKAQKLKLEKKRKQIIKEIKKTPDFLKQFANVEKEVNKFTNEQIENWN